MDTGLSPARQSRLHPRHELHTLTYITLDKANGGIVRDISHRGIGVQMVAAVPPGRHLRVRFELGHPRLRVETLGEVSWSRRSGQCGIRFLDLSPGIARQINQWIFGSLLEEVSQHCAREGSIFSGTMFSGTMFPATTSPGTTLPATTFPESDVTGTPWTLPAPDVVQEDDGLMVSAAPVHVIELPASRDLPAPGHAREHSGKIASAMPSKLDWLFQPLSGRGLIWTINTLVVVAALLLFALVFLSITGEPPRWPFAMAGAAAIFVAALYWGFFRLFGGSSPGSRLARMAGLELEGSEEATDTRFR